MGGAWRVRIITPPLSGEGPLRPRKVRYAGNESGNATSTTMDTYSHVSPGMQEESAAWLDALLEGAN